jgi:histidyl-tRNA synthetase
VMNRRRAASVRHGFDEVDGPTFEHLDLYTVKSGEGIVSELFSFQRTGGDRTYALRPEFTPTLARLYAARASTLPRPTKWFMTGPFFRAERPQRGRLREFLQWNIDLLGLAGDPKSPQEAALARAAADAEVIATCVSLLAGLGLTPRDVRVRINHRQALTDWFTQRGLPAQRHPDLLNLLDARGKMPGAEFSARLAGFGFTPEQAEVFQRGIIRKTVDDPASPAGDTVLDLTFFHQAVTPLTHQLTQAGILDWIDFDLSVVRGLAYYTGMVFEVHEAGGNERAIAGGGRYDNLVELFGGPPTPAVGFGMGDVVLSLVLQDKGLMPPDARIAEAAGIRPDVFVVSNGQPDSEGALRPLVAQLRAAGLHARHTYRTTRNVAKLLQEAAGVNARVAVIIESGSTATVKDLVTGSQTPSPVPIAAVVLMLVGARRTAGAPMA